MFQTHTQRQGSVLGAMLILLSRPRCVKPSQGAMFSVFSRRGRISLSHGGSRRALYRRTQTTSTTITMMTAGPQAEERRALQRLTQTMTTTQMTSRARPQTNDPSTQGRQDYLMRSRSSLSSASRFLMHFGIGPASWTGQGTWTGHGPRGDRDRFRSATGPCVARVTVCWRACSGSGCLAGISSSERHSLCVSEHASEYSCVALTPTASWSLCSSPRSKPRSKPKELAGTQADKLIGQSGLRSTAV